MLIRTYEAPPRGVCVDEIKKVASGESFYLCERVVAVVAVVVCVCACVFVRTRARVCVCVWGGGVRVAAALAVRVPGRALCVWGVFVVAERGTGRYLVGCRTRPPRPI